MANFAVSLVDSTFRVDVGENTQAAANSANAAAASATLSQAWAEGTLPGGAGTKSAKEHATDAAASAASADDAARAEVNDLREELVGGNLLPADHAPGDAMTFLDGSSRRLASIDITGAFRGTETAVQRLQTPRVSVDPGFTAGFADEADGVLLGIRRRSGVVEIPMQGAPNGLAYVSSGAVRAGLRSGADIALSVPGATHSRLCQTGNTVTFWREGDNQIVDELIAPLAPLASGITTLFYVPLYGQSNSVDFGAAPVTRTADAPGRSLTFTSGPYPIAGFSGQYDPLPLRIHDIATLRDCTSDPRPTGEFGETPVPGLGWSMAQIVASNTATLSASFGVGGANISILSKGGDSSLGGAQAYRNLIRSVQRAKVMADLLGVTLVVPAVGWIQGESNHETLYATYDAAYVALQANLDADIKAITGQAQNVLLAAHQVVKKVSGASRNDAVNVVLDRALAEPTKFLCSGPSYPYTHPDGTHSDGTGKRQQGEQLGRAIAQRLAGTTNPMLHIASAVRSSATITLTIGGAEGSLVWDTNVTDPNGARGFQFVQTGGDPVTITDVQISGSTVVITLSAAPTGTAQQVIAAGMGSVEAAAPASGPTTGPRCQLRDSATFLGADGTARPKFLCHQTINVTT